MKKIFLLAIGAAVLIACNDAGDQDTSYDDRDTATSIGSPSTTTEQTYTPAEGDVTYRDNKVLVMRNGEWVETDKDVELENDITVYKDGRVVKDEKEVELEDGEVVDRTGNFFDRTGRAIEKGWDKTKEAVKEAGRDVERAAEKAGDKAEDGHEHDKEAK